MGPARNGVIQKKGFREAHQKHEIQRQNRFGHPLTTRRQTVRSMMHGVLRSVINVFLSCA